MTDTSSRTHVVVALVALSFATLARAELPDLQPPQVLRPKVPDVQPDPNQPPGEAGLGRDVVVKGNLAIAGLPLARNGDGVAAIYVRDAAGTWIQRAILAPTSVTPGANFGVAVSISGRRAVVGSLNAVYSFENDSTGWHQRQTLFFGRPIRVGDIDFEGNLAAIGVGGPSGNNGLHVFLLGADGVFRAITRTIPTDAGPNDQFGESVALNGSTLAVTAPGYNNNQGAAYIFACTNTGCVRKQKLLANDGVPGDRFGDSVDVLSNQLVIGATGADPFTDAEEPPDPEFTGQGVAYVYLRSNATWTETQKLRITREESTRDDTSFYINFGLSVALTSNRIAVGAPYGFTQFEPGKIFIFEKTGGMWIATHAAFGSLGLGHSVSLSGTQLLGGAPQESENRGEADFYIVP